MIGISRIKYYLSNFFTKGHQRSLEAKKNIFASFAIKGLSILIGLVLVPLTIDYINPTRYGIWLTLSSIIGWFSFFDIGFGNGLRNKLAEAKANGDFIKAQSYISTTYALFTLIFTSVWIIFLIVNYYVNWSSVLNAPKEMTSELSKLALIVFSYFCLQFILRTINIVLLADQKPAKSDFFDMIGQMISLVIIYILTKYTQGSLINLGIALGVTPILVLIIASLWLYKNDYRNLRPKISCIHFSDGKSIMGIGLQFFIVQVAALVIFQTNNIVIAQVCGPDSVTVYNIAFKYFGVISMIFMIIMNPFWSAYTEAFVRGDKEWMITTFKKLKKIWLLLAILGFVLLILSKYLLRLWIGNKVQIPMTVSISMLLYFLIFTLLNLYIYIINGIGKIRLQLVFNVILAIINLPLIIVLGHWYGLTGIIIGNVLTIIPHAIYSPVQLKKLINGNAKGIWNK